MGDPSRNEPAQRMPARPKSNREIHLTHDVQTGLLKRFKDDIVPLTVCLMGGSTMHGVVRRYDTFVIDFRDDAGKSVSCTSMASLALLQITR